jgi:predicted dehydrogenase
MGKLRLGVVGVGHLGKEHARILSSLAEVELVGVADVRPDQLHAVAQRCQTLPFLHYRDLIPLVDAACVVVPTAEHRAVAADFITAGKAVLVEKPLAATASEAAELVALARRHGVILQVGHIERFNPAFVDVQRRPLRPKFIQAERFGPFSGRGLDVGVVLDLMIHDLDLVLTLVGSEVSDVEAVGVSVFGQHEDLAYARLRFRNGCVATLAASRVARQPRRIMHLLGAEGWATINFGQRRVEYVQPSPLLQRCDVRSLDAAALAQFREHWFSRCFDSKTLDFQGVDQLTAELRHFVDCVRSRQTPLVSGDDGLAALLLAERVQTSMGRHAWEGDLTGPCGPCDLPAPSGPLFVTPAAAAWPRAA